MPALDLSEVAAWALMAAGAAYGLVRYIAPRASLAGGAAIAAALAGLVVKAALLDLA
jgi:hypothetical protein